MKIKYDEKRWVKDVSTENYIKFKAKFWNQPSDEHFFILLEEMRKHDFRLFFIDHWRGHIYFERK